MSSLVEGLDFTRCLGLINGNSQFDLGNFDDEKLTMSVPIRFLTVSELRVASDWANCARFNAALRSEKGRLSKDACCGLVTLIVVGAGVIWRGRDWTGASTCFA